jgi:hypothetical protein
MAKANYLITIGDDGPEISFFEDKRFQRATMICIFVATGYILEAGVIVQVNQIVSVGAI